MKLLGEKLRPVHTVVHSFVKEATSPIEMVFAFIQKLKHQIKQDLVFPHLLCGPHLFTVPSLQPQIPQKFKRKTIVQLSSHPHVLNPACVLSVSL